MNLSSPNRIVWTYFDFLRRLVQRIGSTGNRPEQKDEIVISLVIAVAAVEVFVNLFFRVLVTEPSFQQHKQLVLDDLDTSQPGGPKGVDYKLRHWPPKVLGKSLAWPTGVAKDFNDLRELRNALMHFTSSHQSIALPGMEIQGLADTTVYDSLGMGDATKALEVAEGIVTEIFRLKGMPEAQIPTALHQWTGRVCV